MLAVSAVPAQQNPLPPEEAPLAEWPPGWASAYRRFEGFMAAKKRQWPLSGLQMVDDVAFIHGVPGSKPDGKDVGLEITMRGGMTLSTATAPPKPTDLTHLDPGLYSICAYASGILDYQYHFPIVWFESVEAKTSGPLAQLNGPLRKLRMVPAPGDGMSVFPNERLLGFRDFHIFTQRRYRNDIQKENQSASPSIHLGIDEHGVVERDILPDAKAEALLHWRIYHNGKLVESGAATGIARHEMKWGPGNYLVIAGPEGPAGFLPISNFLEFPLFPDGTDSFLVYPRDSDADGTPDFIQTMMESGRAESSDIPVDRDSDGDGLTDIKEAGPLTAAPVASSQPHDRQLLQLWRQWAYTLKNRKSWWK